MTLAALVLAAGAGTRFGGDKLSAPFLGKPLLRHAIRAARDAPVSFVVVVHSPSLSPGAWQGDPPVHPLNVASTALSESLKAGAAAAGEVEGLFVYLGDMPFVPGDIGQALVASIGDAFAARPFFRGRPGHPVLLSRAACAAMTLLSGDEGAGRLLRGRETVELEWDDEGVCLDVDRPEDIATLEKRFRRGPDRP